ncbi:hypothetical protein BU25DRAFT_410587 [Macroventuria anomochaeta]|uniref:Uncharacterized protein n=1 Tax=Macroventuria anomochaeta TaxID=301207 RepID=A0ACB6S354_9PLEO|nr:uncharacterized protein BU25DRAFT_410587 [Macroventuria anomochaeta]KAF2627957.1 hypothetical protein BU25DRAFT_410587 [Macroventuria anomochaeta]
MQLAGQVQTMHVNNSCLRGVLSDSYHFLQYPACGGVRNVRSTVWCSNLALGYLGNTTISFHSKLQPLVYLQRRWTLRHRVDVNPGRLKWTRATAGALTLGVNCPEFPQVLENRLCKALVNMKFGEDSSARLRIRFVLTIYAPRVSVKTIDSGCKRGNAARTTLCACQVLVEQTPVGY